jgi:transposase InsO family protein
MDVREQRVQFVVAAIRKEKPFRALCQEFGISRPTGRLWLQRYREQGIEGIAERSRRPHYSPGKTAADLEERVVDLRERYPDWGARKLQHQLRSQGLALSVSTVHRILLRHGLVREEDRHRPALQRFERAVPNELWQMDFKGPSWWRTPVGPLSVLDDHSRYLVVLQAIGHARGDLVRRQLEHAFAECGVPQGMLMDHGSPWWSELAPLGATNLSLWLMRQGIRLHWSGYRHPQTQGKVERFHGSLERALQRRGTREMSAQEWLDAYRWEHNHVRPHEALGMNTPASRWQPSPKRYDPHPPRWEYAEGARVLKVDNQGKITLAGRNWKVGKAFIGERVQVVTVESRWQIYYCSTLIRELDLESQRATAVARWLSSGVV